MLAGWFDFIIFIISWMGQILTSCNQGSDEGKGLWRLNLTQEINSLFECRPMTENMLLNSLIA